MQLQAFLRSYERHVQPLGNLSVLYTASTDWHQAAYDAVLNDYSWAVPHCQTSFKDDVLLLVPPSGNVVFFVDDQVFIRPWQVSEQPGLSLRLASHLTRCYTMSLPMPTPTFVSSNGDKVSWRWADGVLDWRYPLSLDGHVFSAAEMRELIEKVSFFSPNSLEAALQVFLPTFLGREGVCYHGAKIVNVPWNRVQKECANRFGAGPTSDEMLALWEEGKQIDLSGVCGAVNESCHQEFEFRTEAR